jgi:hypothetical protein
LVGRRADDPVVGGQLGQPGAVTEPAQHQHRLPVAVQRPAPTSGAAAAALGGQQPDTKCTVSSAMGSTAVSVTGSGTPTTSVVGIREKTSLLPRSCAGPGHLPAVGVSTLTSQPSATGTGSLRAAGGDHRSSPACPSSFRHDTPYSRRDTPPRGCAAPAPIPMLRRSGTTRFRSMSGARMPPARDQQSAGRTPVVPGAVRAPRERSMPPGPVGNARPLTDRRRGPRGRSLPRRPGGDRAPAPGRTA